MSSTLPPATHPIHTLMDKLFELYVRLKHTGGQSGAMNVLEAYNHFIRESDRGRACSMALKCKSLFTTQDYEDIKKLVEEVVSLYEWDETR